LLFGLQLAGVAQSQVTCLSGSPLASLFSGVTPLTVTSQTQLESELNLVAAGPSIRKILQLSSASAVVWTLSSTKNFVDAGGTHRVCIELASGSAAVTVAYGGGRHFNCGTSSANANAVQIIDITVDGISAGGGIASTSNCPVAAVNARFTNNKATTGGAISITSNVGLTITNTQFIANSASATGSGALGGAVYCKPCIVAMSQATFSLNEVVLATPCTSCQGGPQANGAGFYCEGCSGTITDSTFDQNQGRISTGSGGVTGNGGGAYILSPASPNYLTISSTSFTSNKVWYGGGIYYFGGGSSFPSSALFILYLRNNVRFVTNLADFDGGGILCAGDSVPRVEVGSNALFDGNEIGGVGGGFIVRDPCHINFGPQATFTNNKAASGGSAFSLTGAGANVTLGKGPVFRNNQNKNGGATSVIDFYVNPKLFMGTDGIFENNNGQSVHIDSDSGFTTGVAQCIDPSQAANWDGCSPCTQQRSITNTGTVCTAPTRAPTARPTNGT